MQSDEKFLNQDYGFIESIKNKQKYDKNDDLEILELAVQLKNFHMPNYMKFPKSSMRRIQKRPRRYITPQEKRTVKLFYSRLIPHVKYSADELVKMYNSYF